MNTNTKLCADVYCCCQAGSEWLSPFLPLNEAWSTRAGVDYTPAQHATSAPPLTRDLQLTGTRVRGTVYNGIEN